MELAGPALLIILAVILYLGSIALVLWIGYRLVRAAVKNGILDADAARGRTTPPA